MTFAEIPPFNSTLKSALEPVRSLFTFILKKQKDLLTHYLLKGSFATQNSFLYASQKVIGFVEDNVCQEACYLLQASDFNNIFSKFTEYLEAAISVDVEDEIIFKLIQSEYTLQIMSNFSRPQDVTVYLKLFEKYCFHQEASNILELLYGKYDDWSDDCAEMYLHWLHFFIPYLEFLSIQNFESNAIINIKAPDSLQLIRNHLKSLKQWIASQKGQWNFDEDILDDPKQFLGNMLKLREIFLQGSITRDSEYYYMLGLWSFIVHFTEFTMNPHNFTLLQIFIHAIKYKGMPLSNNPI